MFYYYNLIKLLRLNGFFRSLKFLVEGHWGTWTVVNLSQLTSAEDLPMEWKGANKIMQID